MILIHHRTGGQEGKVTSVLDKRRRWHYGSKVSKKENRALSRKIPTKKEWTLEEAKTAFETEKLYNTSKIVLIIKFPDHELNKDIVSQFHPAIENIHFQQPCTPRFCCITLRESTDPDEVINALNKHKFGQGLLKVEYKKDRDEDNAVVPDDIDPLTLYLGSFPREVTEDHLRSIYPNNKRIDICFANKVTCTRYAFIAFRTAAECLEAFKKTHKKQLHIKSCIVRFRRLNGTFAVPGETKPQNPPKNVETTNNVNITKSSSDSATSEVINDDNSSIRVDTLLMNDDDRNYNMDSGHLWNHRPQPKKKSTLYIKNDFDPSRDGFSIDKVKSESWNAVNIKSEPTHSDDDLDITNLFYDKGNESDANDKEKNVDVFADMMDFNRIYEDMMNHKRNISMLKLSNHSKDTPKV
ncbi:hypothetical protein FQR65_LT02751 [Abscondita terminalis]|nr:hypothetical protein FQR65_LT02751 [Abscondita terminalis]